MSVTQSRFGTDKEGKALSLYTIRNGNGTLVQVTDLGATIVSIQFQDKNEKMQDLYRQYFDEFSLDYRITVSSSDAMSALTEADFRSRPYDAVIIGSELDHPGSTFDLASYLSKSFPQLVLILASSHDWGEIEYRANRSGIHHFVPLPIFRQTLINAVNQALLGEESGDTASAAPDLSGKNILLVEDNMINREIACEILNSTNAHIDTAEDGRQAVEQLLWELGQRLPGYVRSEDIPCRYEGEVFCVILPGADLKITRQRADKIRNEISQLQIAYGDTILATTLSMGVSVMPVHASDVNSLLYTAAASMQLAIQSAGNRVIIADALNNR